VPDILVNNAGIAREAFLTDTSEEDWDAVIDTNLKGVFMMAQATAKAMINAEKPGSIINIASILGLRIRVNALAPGYFITEINEERFADGRGDEYMQQRVPMGRVGELPLLLLASGAGSYMTGSIVAVDGGHVCSSL
jgi:NAD(P)-dependent dehydrogenase (short-subunit alcohol dehydrogenase family)